MAKKNPKNITKTYCIDQDTWEEFEYLCSEERIAPGSQVYQLIRKFVVSQRDSNMPIVEESVQ
jgi:hypothetical protein